MGWFQLSTIPLRDKHASSWGGLPLLGHHHYPAYESPRSGTKVRHRVSEAREVFGHDGPEAGEEGSLDYGRLRRHSHRYGWNSTMVRLVTIILAIVIPGVSVIPTLLIYFLLGYLLPETDEF